MDPLLKRGNEKRRNSKVEVLAKLCKIFGISKKTNLTPSDRLSSKDCKISCVIESNLFTHECDGWKPDWFGFKIYLFGKKIYALLKIIFSNILLRTGSNEMWNEVIFLKNFFVVFFKWTGIIFGVFHNSGKKEKIVKIFFK